MHKIEYILNWISLVGTPVSFIVALSTWCNTKNIQKSVDSALEKQELNKNINKYKLACDDFIDYLKSEPLYYNSQKIIDMRLLFKEINEKYPNINPRIINSNNKILDMLSNNNEIKNQLSDIRIDIIDALSLIKNTLEKEIRK